MLPSSVYDDFRRSSVHAVTAEAAIAISALLVSLGAIAHTEFSRRREQQNRRDELAASVQSERARQEAEKRDVAVVVQLVVKEGANEAPTWWWRLSMTGGNSYSRTAIEELLLWSGADDSWEDAVDNGRSSPSNWTDLWPDQKQLVLHHGQPIHVSAPFGGVLAGHAREAHGIFVEWSTFGDHHSMSRAVYPEPW